MNGIRGRGVCVWKEKGSLLKGILELGVSGSGVKVTLWISRENFDHASDHSFLIASTTSERISFLLFKKTQNQVSLYGRVEKKIKEHPPI